MRNSKLLAGAAFAVALLAGCGEDRGAVNGYVWNPDMARGYGLKPDTLLNISDEAILTACVGGEPFGPCDYTVIRRGPHVWYFFRPAGKAPHPWVSWFAAETGSWTEVRNGQSLKEGIIFVRKPDGSVVRASQGDAAPRW